MFAQAKNLRSYFESWGPKAFKNMPFTIQQISMWSGDPEKLTPKILWSAKSGWKFTKL